MNAEVFVKLFLNEIIEELQSISSLYDKFSLVRQLVGQIEYIPAQKIHNY